MIPLPFGVSLEIYPFWRAEASLIHQTYLLTSNADNWITSDKTEEEILNFFNEICLVINICLHTIFQITTCLLDVCAVCSPKAWEMTVTKSKSPISVSGSRPVVPRPGCHLHRLPF